MFSTDNNTNTNDNTTNNATEFNCGGIIFEYNFTDALADNIVTDY